MFFQENLVNFFLMNYVFFDQLIIHFLSLHLLIFCNSAHCYSFYYSNFIWMCIIAPYF